MRKKLEKNRAIISKLDMKSPNTWLATWFGIGFMIPAPGTWGTIAGLPFAIIFFLIGGIPLLVLAIVIFYFIGIYVSNKIEEQTKEKDLSIIVIDEVVGIWIALLATNFEPLQILIAFILFRFFDILKPWPIGWLDKNIASGRGVMIDDVVAGLFAAIITGGLIHVFNI